MQAELRQTVMRFCPGIIKACSSAESRKQVWALTQVGTEPLKRSLLPTQLVLDAMIPWYDEIRNFEFLALLIVLSC